MLDFGLSEGVESITSRDVTSFVAGIVAILALRVAVKASGTPEPLIIKAPARETGPGAKYPTTYYPGARDIETPYGAIRIYEFGPEDGERLLFVHGITTPSPVFCAILPKMAEAGYRICTFDLFGRGYSDSPDLKHDDRLYVTQILCVLQAVGWSKCTMVGYSLGGCLTSSFASYFAESIDKLILIAPAGLLARKDIPFVRKVAMNENVPFSLIDTLKTLVVPKPKEIAEKVAGGRVDVSHVTQWQAENHKGFGRSYLSSFRYAPIFDQWELFARLRGKKLDIHAIWGDRDDIVDTALVSGNLQQALPELKLTLIRDAGHDVCTSKPNEIIENLLRILKG